MIKQIRTIKYPKIILQKAIFKTISLQYDPDDTSSIKIGFANGLILGNEEQEDYGCIDLKIHDVNLENLSITYFTDTTPQQKISLAQLKKDIEQLQVEVIQEYYNHFEVFIRAEIKRPEKDLFINICIPHHGEVHYLYKNE